MAWYPQSGNVSGGDLVVYEQTIAQLTNADSVDWALRMLDDQNLIGEAINEVADLNSEALVDCTTIDELLNSPDALNAVTGDLSASNILASSPTVIAKLAVASSDAINAVASNPVSLATIYMSQKAVATFKETSSTGWNTFKTASNVDGVLAQASAIIIGENPDIYNTMDKIIASSLILTRCLNNSNVLSLWGEYSVSTNKLAMNVNARTSIINSSFAMNAISNSYTATFNFVSVTDFNAVAYTNDNAMRYLFSSALSLSAIANVPNARIYYSGGPSGTIESAAMNRKYFNMAVIALSDENAFTRKAYHVDIASGGNSNQYANGANPTFSGTTRQADNGIFLFEVYKRGGTGSLLKISSLTGGNQLINYRTLANTFPGTPISDFNIVNFGGLVRYNDGLTYSVYVPK